ncbi:MAG: type II toxin-antitoxin system RelE/ParE family toxin [Bacteroidetes bacterium]|nr:type II toxin-antitoxin system RelE/ParE family toxin [Bacteroidota bacterium]
MKQKLEISKEAWDTLNELAEFVESKNTLGAGNRYLNSFLIKIKDALKSHAKYAVCKYPEFAKLELKCLIINDWVIAYQESKDILIVKAIIHGTLLNY